jgi:polar amino acid transport system substrate-binding protein
LEKWFGTDDSAKTIDRTGLSGENGSVLVSVIPDIVPFSYIANNELQGYAVEIMIDFGRKYGYNIEFEQANVAACLAGLASEKYDILASCVSVTEERKESMNFSDVVYNGGIMLVGRTSDLTVASASSVEDRPFSYYANDKKIGAITGGLYEVKILERFPDADILQFNNQPDMAVALSSGIIDAFTCPRSTAEDFMKSDPTLTCLNEVFMEIPYGFAFQKSTDQEYLRDQMNEFLQKIHSDGTYDEIVEKWFGDDESIKHVDYSGLNGKNGTLRYITASTMQPFSYIENGKNAGIEVDIITRFCTEYGYDLKIDNAEFASLIPGITSGTYDIASGTIMITEERAESVNFSDVYYTADAVAVVRKETSAQTDSNPAEKNTFLASIRSSFEKNFLRESRWKLILQGIGTTCIITVLTVLFGSVLAFLICLFRRTDSILAGKIADIYVKILQGTPMVVLLMILYYVIFGKSGMPAIWVAVIGFSLNFAAYTSETLRSGIDSIDGGQREAALALGYSEHQAFFRFIFPQAAVRQLPVYRGEMISLLKNTSIVGYIAIQDLTKMSDIIRSRTYEAFFPLIVTAIIYFILAWIISIILKAVLKQIDPHLKKRTVKGVTTK